jgi:hypothetical protein
MIIASYLSASEIHVSRARNSIQLNLVWYTLYQFCLASPQYQNPSLLLPHPPQSHHLHTSVSETSYFRRIRPRPICTQFPHKFLTSAASAPVGSASKRLKISILLKANAVGTFARIFSASLSCALVAFSAFFSAALASAAFFSAAAGENMMPTNSGTYCIGGS